LAAFLENNDCLKSKDQVYCYKLTRVQLIMVTKQLDEMAVQGWAAKMTIKQLVDNINVIINGLDKRSDAIAPPVDATPK